MQERVPLVRLGGQHAGHTVLDWNMEFAERLQIDPIAVEEKIRSYFRDGAAPVTFTTV